MMMIGKMILLEYECIQFFLEFEKLQNSILYILLVHMLFQWIPIFKIDDPNFLKNSVYYIYQLVHLKKKLHKENLLSSTVQTCAPTLQKPLCDLVCFTPVRYSKCLGPTKFFYHFKKCTSHHSNFLKSPYLLDFV